MVARRWREQPLPCDVCGAVKSSADKAAHQPGKMRGLRLLFLPLLAVVSSLLTAVYVLDLIYTTKHISACEMTYSWPVYTRFRGAPKHHKYELYSVHMKQRRTKLTGIPVLFIPGHMGSYKQARSIGRHLWNADSERFDLFAVDFQQELSGLNGQFVMDQAAYVNDAIRSILRQYKNQKERGRAIPESVVIFAHSMGGIVARTAETLPNYKRKSIQHVISLGTPYSRPPYPLDVDMQTVYDKMTLASMKGRSSDPLYDFVDEAEVPASASVYISIAGGHKDTTIHASASITDRVVFSSRGLALLTTAMPEVTTTMDHLCLLWCHQLLEAIAKSLYASVDLATGELVKSPAKRLEIARQVLLGEIESEDHQAIVAAHREYVLDGYNTEEFEQYGLWLPQQLFFFLRTRYTALFVVMYAFVLHIFHVQIAHWQNRFTLQTPLDASTENFPSFASMLHPAAHIPRFIPSTISLAQEQLEKFHKGTALAALIGGSVMVLGVLAEYGRRNPLIVSSLLEWVALYLYAIGLLYCLAVIFSMVRNFVLVPVMTFLSNTLDRFKVKRWMLIVCIYGIVFIFGQIKNLASFEFASVDSARTLVLLILGSFIVCLVYLLALGGNNDCSMDQQRVQNSLFGLMALSIFPWVGVIAYFLEIVRFPPPQISNDLMLEGASYIALLAMFRYLMTLSQDQMLPLPPTAFFGASSGQDAASTYSRSLSMDSSTPISAENCPKCIFEDGGPGAILQEYIDRSTQRIVNRSTGEVVMVGPTFRVVSCDCVYRFERSRDFCEFCIRSCRLCGGGDGNFQQAQKYKDFLEASKMEIALHGLIPFTFELLALIQVTYGLHREYMAFYITPIGVIAMLIYHLVLRNPNEPKRAKKKTKSKTKTKKKKKSKAKTTTKTSSNVETKNGRTVTRPSSSSTATNKTKQKSSSTAYTPLIQEVNPSELD